MSTRPLDRSSPTRFIPGLVLAFVLSALLLVAGAPAALAGQAEALVWFGDLEAAAPLPDEAGPTLIAAATAALDGAAARDALPRPLVEDREPRIVWLSIGDGGGPARVALGAGRGIAAAIDAAAAEARSHGGPGIQPRWLKLDVVQGVAPLGPLDPAQPLPIDTTLDGLAFGRPLGMALLAEESSANRLIDSAGILRIDRTADYLADRPGWAQAARSLRSAGAMPEYRFTTAGFFSDGRDVRTLYRGNRVVREASADDVMSAARLAGEYLVRATGPDGRFVYEYRPRTGGERDAYNILRHAGTVYAMLELHQLTGEPALREAADRALGSLLAAVRPCRAGAIDAACVVEGNEIKLGGNALAIVALAKYVEVTGDRQHLGVAQQLARWIQGVQDEQGRFAVHKQFVRTGEVASFESGYYPGEALLALARLYALDGDERWLDTAERGARYLIEIRDRGRSDAELPHDHWLLYALNDLYRQRPAPLYLNHAMRIAGAIVARQLVDPAQPDWAGGYLTGGFDTVPRSTPAAIRAEGLYAAYLLARDFDRLAEAGSILGAIRRGVAFQLRTQYQPESAMYFGDPRRTLGGFRGSFYSSEIRIDYVQHNLSALLGLHRILAEQAPNDPRIVPGGPLHLPARSAR